MIYNDKRTFIWYNNYMISNSLIAIASGVVLDLVLLGVIALFLIIGLWKGLFKSVLSIFGFTSSLLVAFLIRVPVSSLIDKIFNLSNAIGNKIMSPIVASNPLIESFKTTNATELTNTVNNSNVSGVVKTLFNKLIGTGAFDQPVSVVDIIGNKIGIIGTRIVAVVAMFVLLRIAMFILNKMFKGLKKKNVLGKIDRALGGLFGLAKGLLIVIVVFSAFSLVRYIPSQTEKIDNVISSSCVSKYGYKVVDDFISNKIGND